MRYRGKITTWKDNRGFGFITPNGGGDQVYVHITSFENQRKRPIGNEFVSYNLKIDAKGRHQAKNVSFKYERLPSKYSRRTSYTLIISAASFLLFVTVVTLVGALPSLVLLAYLIASTITFIVYALDKSAAKNNKWRTQESTLHLFELIGGWPGALIAQKLFRHKSKKQSYQIVFWIIVMLNCGFLGWTLTEPGRAMLRSVLDGAFKLFK